MAQYEHLPIYKAAFDLLVYFEDIVSRFSRYNKYVHGFALRQITLDVVMLIVRANNTPDKLKTLEEIRIRRILLSQILSRLAHPELKWLAETIIMHDPVKEARFTCSPAKWRKVPPQKSLFSVPEGKGLPIGNITSQFFANVYLNPLDQFVKHKLKAKYYIRYVDDMVLLHQNKEVLGQWIIDINDFLHCNLKLELHSQRRKTAPVTNGINFLGYITKPTHLLVRRRVVARCKDAIKEQTCRMIENRAGTVQFHFPEDRYEKLHATINSYLGIFGHASSFRLVNALHVKFPMVAFLFFLQKNRMDKRWALPFKPANLYTQYRFFRKIFKGLIMFQVGCFIELYDRDAIWASEELSMERITPRKGFYARCGAHIRYLEKLKRQMQGYNILVVRQSNSYGFRVRPRTGEAACLPYRTDGASTFPDQYISKVK